MKRGVLFGCALLIGGCAAQPPAPPLTNENLGMSAERMSGADSPAPLARPSREPETLVDDRTAARLAHEFALPRCDNIARLRDVRGGGAFVQSWRVRGDAACFADWAARHREYGMLERLLRGQTKADLDRLPWLCDESGGHVAQCSNQGRRVTLVIENPRFAPFLLFRRITRQTN